MTVTLRTIVSLLFSVTTMLAVPRWAAAQAPPPPSAPSETEHAESLPAQATLRGEQVPERLPSDTPPPSSYDRLRQENNEPLPEERSLVSQLLRTVFALGIVVGLIYLVFKLGLGRLLQGGSVAGLRSKSREIKIVERTLIDGKNALVLIDLGDKRRVLVGTGERGVSYLCEVEHATEDAEPSRSFNEVLEENAGDKHEA